MNARAEQLRRDDGASAVEYSLLVVAIAAVIVAVVFALGGFVTDTYSDTCGEFQTATSAPAGSCP